MNFKPIVFNIITLKGKVTQDVKAPGFLDNRHTKVVGLSALSTGRL
jgi:hypothetical protein